MTRTGQRRRPGARRRHPAGPGAWHPLTWLVLASASLLPLTTSPQPLADQGHLTVGVAVSLLPPLTAIAERYESQEPALRVRLTAGASSALGAQVRAGAPIDILISADPAILAMLARGGWITQGSIRPIATGRIVVVRSLASTQTWSSFISGGTGGRLAIPGPAVPLGRYARAWLGARTEGLQRTGRLIVTEHARATLAAVELGHADFAVVYETDASRTSRAEIVVRIPPAEQPRIVYAAAPVGKEERPEVRAFVEFLRSDEALAVLRSEGFGSPPSASAPARTPTARATESPDPDGG